MNFKTLSLTPHHRRLVAGLFGLATVIGGVVHAQSNSTPTSKIETGISYSRGDYGLAADTEVWVAPLNWVYESSHWRIRATLPWLHVTGPAAVVANGGGTAGGPSRPNDASTSGLGDSLLTLTYKTNPQTDGWHTDLTTKVKFPTGDESRGLGTGENDFYAQIDLYRSFATGLTPFFNGGYRWLGDGLYQLQDGPYASGGLVVSTSDNTSVGASVDWRDEIVAGGDDALETTVFYYHRISTQWSTTVYAQKGFTDASPDIGAGASFSFSF